MPICLYHTWPDLKKFPNFYGDAVTPTCLCMYVVCTLYNLHSIRNLYRSSKIFSLSDGLTLSLSLSPSLTYSLYHSPSF